MPAPVWLILPTYDERENLEPLVGELLPVLARAAPESFRILVVDDASPDGTGALADALAARLEAVQVLHRPAKEGLGPAYLAGFDVALRAGARYVMQMDADFSHDPADVVRLLAAARGGADLALGSRYVPGGGLAAPWHPARRALSRAGCWYARTVLGVGVRDLTGGFKCFARGGLEAIELHSVASHGYAFQVEMTYRVLRRGLRVQEVPILFHERRHGRSKMTAAIALEAAVRVPRLRLGAPGAR